MGRGRVDGRGEDAIGTIARRDDQRISGGDEPVGLEPVQLGCQRLAPPVEGPEHRAADRAQVGEPPALGIRLDVAGPA